MIIIKRFDTGLGKKYQKDITEYYYQNVISNSCRLNFKYEQAQKKIDGLMDYLEMEVAICFGAFDGENMVGFIWAYNHEFRDEPRVYVSELRVEEHYRNQGIAKKLLNSVEAIAKAQGLPAMYIHAEASNIGAISLYEKFGFEQERIQLRKYLGEFDD